MEKASFGLGQEIMLFFRLFSELFAWARKGLL